MSGFKFYHGTTVQLLNYYQKKLKTTLEKLRDCDLNIEKKTRLQTKVMCYKAFISDLKRELKRFDLALDLSMENLTKETLLEQTMISTRTIAVLDLNGFRDKKIGDLENYKIGDLCKFKDMSRKTLYNLKEVCRLAGFTLSH